MKISASWDAVAYEQHLAILNNFVGEVLPDVDVLGSLPSTDDVVTPLDARRVVFVNRRGRRLGEPHTLEELAEVQNLASRRRCRLVLRLCCSQSRCLLHLGFPHGRRLRSLVVQHQVS